MCLIRDKLRPATARQRQARRRGLTLLEMILALAGLGLIGAAIAAMTGAVAYGTASERDLRGLVAKRQALSARLGAHIRESRRVLDVTDDTLVLWKRDKNDDDKPSLNEVLRIEYEADKLRAYTGKASATGVLSVTLNWLEQTAGTQQRSQMNESLWAEGVTAFAIDLEPNTPADARLVSYRLTLEAGDLAEQAVGAAALRGQEGS